MLLYLFMALGISFTCSVLEAVLLSTPMSFITMKEQEGGGKSALLLKKYKQNIDKPISAILSHRSGGSRSRGGKNIRSGLFRYHIGYTYDTHSGTFRDYTQDDRCFVLAAIGAFFGAGHTGIRLHLLSSGATVRVDYPYFFTQRKRGFGEPGRSIGHAYDG